MNKHLDFTIDFETAALTANAAVMQVAIVPWQRDANSAPICEDMYPFVGYVDLRTCVTDGFDFDKKTIQWWTERSEAARCAVTDGKPQSIKVVLLDALNYIRGVKRSRDAESICLWSQGIDFDMAVLRNLCQKYDVDLEEYIPHTSFRDSRTIILEAAMNFCEKVTPEEYEEEVTACDILRNPSLAYSLYDQLPEQYANGREAHDALYDATRTSWYTWQALKWLCER